MYLPGGDTCQRGVPAQGATCWGVYLPDGGVLARGVYLPGGDPARGGCTCPEGYLPGRYLPGGCLVRYPPVNRMNDRQV